MDIPDVPITIADYMAKTLIRRHREHVSKLPKGGGPLDTMVLGMTMVLVEVLCSLRMGLEVCGLGDQFDDMLTVARAKCDESWPTIAGLRNRGIFVPFLPGFKDES